MRFWDTSALVLLIVDEPATNVVRGWLAEDGELALWGLTRVELASAIERRTREGRLSRDERRAALQRVDRLCSTANEVYDLAGVRTRALRVLALHPLRAADALQLGAALVVAEAFFSEARLATFDSRLAEAAEREGLVVFSSLAPDLDCHRAGAMCHSAP